MTIAMIFVVLLFLIVPLLLAAWNLHHAMKDLEFLFEDHEVKK